MKDVATELTRIINALGAVRDLACIRGLKPEQVEHHLHCPGFLAACILDGATAEQIRAALADRLKVKA